MQPVLYREEQHFSQWWVWIIVLGVAAACWWAFIQQILLGRPFGNNAAPDWAVVLIWVVIGLGLPFLFEALKLVIVVTSDEVRARFRPFGTRIIAVSEIVSAQARQYNAVKEYGGWGVKGWSTKKVSFNVKGSWGVDLTLRDGRSILLGSQRAQELEAAIAPLIHKKGSTSAK